MIDSFLFVGLPYLAIAVAVVGTVYRTRYARLGYTSRSSQFLESRKLLWGSVPWHVGILLVLLGHAVAFLFPGAWRAVVARPAALIALETVGFALALLSLVGLGILAVRRITGARLQAVTSAIDIVVLVLLLGQVALGILVAVSLRWGSAWSTGTTTPYLWSILLLRPDPATIADLSVLVKAHIVGAWLFLAVLPFSKLVHLLAVPWQYVLRAPQKVVWNNPRRAELAAMFQARGDARREFIRGAAGVAAGGALLSGGAAVTLLRYFLGGRAANAEGTELLETKLERLEATAEQKQLELERRRSEFILVAKLADLKDTVGTYFIDYQMRPALAFRGEDGLPRLISAKCTHLGCTVSSQVDANGKILCPCHVSYFDVKTGQTNANSPAKAPLPLLGWVVMDDGGQVVASQAPGSAPSGRLDPARLCQYGVYIARRHERSVS